ncbi:hypothetical protein [Acinetobacter guillouiae]|uniref:hypothetical protein n=1 Tax=Acinetobacter guillouiae TaxID=106649 RepID=UPI0026E4647C|nr:hypothetical protein [Acinetobacter guillouiae]MDO6644704.1 hypothetical protein [Acinetobacter guillouiae]
MRRKKFTKVRFYRRLEAQKKKCSYYGFDYGRGDYSVTWNLEPWHKALKNAGSVMVRLIGEISEKRFKHLYSCNPKSR